MQTIGYVWSSSAHGLVRLDFVGGGELGTELSELGAETA